MLLVRRRLTALRWRIETLRALSTARRDSLARLDGTTADRVLVVCYGNIYRSAFVEAYFANWPVAGVEVRSVGLHPVGGRESPLRHVAMSRAYDVELGTHRSKVLTQDDLRWAQLVVLMDRHNWQALTTRGVDRQRQVWLGALTTGPIEIPDPYGLDDAQAERVIARLFEGSSTLAERLSRRQARPSAV